MRAAGYLYSDLLHERTAWTGCSHGHWGPVFCGEAQQAGQSWTGRRSPVEARTGAAQRVGGLATGAELTGHPLGESRQFGVFPVPECLI